MTETKRHWAFLLLPAFAAVATLGVAACGSSDEGASDDGPAAEAASDGSLLPGSTSLTTAPPDGPIPAVQEIDVDPDDPMNDDPIPEGATRIRYAYGPIEVTSGANNIVFSEDAVPRPDVPGYIVRISPNLRQADGTTIPSDQVMFHHGVWLNTSREDPTASLPERIFAAGEEKTIATMPAGYGYDYDPEDEWILNYMLHNLTAATEELWITYDLDLIPADAPQAEGMATARPIWMDVQNGSAYPVFDVLLGSGEGGTYTYPDQAAPDDDGRQKAEWTVDRDSVILFGAGHLHAGGTSVDLFVRRGDREVQLVNSRAEYYDPNGPVSWDLAMTATPDDFRVAVQAGDVLRISTTYDSERAAWYESMGIMVLSMADAGTGPDEGVDPFETAPSLDGEVTHGHLEENSNHGGEPTELPDVTELPDGAIATEVDIDGFGYSDGDLESYPSDVPTVRAGEEIRFENLEAEANENGIWHTVTSCEAPCNRSTGIGYPLADGRFAFDSGQLGDAGEPTAGRVTWTTPTDLEPGTYTYFCRIHPGMRGAFRVVE